MNLKEQRAAKFKAAQDIVSGAKDRDLTDDEQKSFDSLIAEVKEFDASINRATASAIARKALGDLSEDEKHDDAPGKEPAVKSLGEHAAKHMHARLKEIKGVSGASVSAPEFKAATDTHVTGAWANPVINEYDRTIVRGVRPRLVVSDLLGSGTLSGNAISYFVEAALEGAFTTVAEGAAKPQLHVVDPTMTTDVLKKIAGWIKLTDEMTEDLDFFVSEINQRLLYELAKFEEAQLLNGNGTGSNVLGLLNRVGVQTEATGTVASGDTGADALFRAMTKVQTGGGEDADGIILHPTDYQNLRLAKDANKQYYGGGYFAGQYGSGTLQDQPPVWGLRTVVTPAITAGTALVGAFGTAATVYRKGGVRVESTNSHASDFTSNLVTVRAEERVALAVRRPSAFVKVTVTNAP